VLAGVVLAFALILGWQWWQQRRASALEQSSIAYDAVLVALGQGDAGQVRARGQEVVSRWPDSTYAALAALAMAKAAADANDAPAALASLDWAAAHASATPLRELAQLRAARVLLAEQRYDEAARRLDQVKSPALAPEREELRGDLAWARNDAPAARAAWQAALAAAGPEFSALLQLKLDNLPAQEQQK